MWFIESIFDGRKYLCQAGAQIIKPRNIKTNPTNPSDFRRCKCNILGMANDTFLLRKKTFHGGLLPMAPSIGINAEEEDAILASKNRNFTAVEDAALWMVKAVVKIQGFKSILVDVM
ncbi:hypothetical protein E5288_WYG011616 [Bos mutus]|uniref:Uncharacterized protein n=1 Tax=Bos mutus TaxID=72004 RepID=A0A6B0S6C3_9CETA|nr:hypothetical protein [Bos mutus]